MRGEVWGMWYVVCGMRCEVWGMWYVFCVMRCEVWDMCYEVLGVRDVWCEI